MHTSLFIKLHQFFDCVFVNWGSFGTVNGVTVHVEHIGWYLGQASGITNDTRHGTVPDNLSSFIGESDPLQFSAFLVVEKESISLHGSSELVFDHDMKNFS